MKFRKKPVIIEAFKTESFIRASRIFLKKLMRR